MAFVIKRCIETYFTTRAHRGPGVNPQEGNQEVVVNKQRQASERLQPPESRNTGHVIGRFLES